MTPSRLEDLVAEGARRRPDRAAVVDRDGGYSYSQLDRKANGLAARLREAGCDPGDRVVLLAPKSKETILGMVGTLRAGGVYVPMDPGSPPARIRKILRSCEPRVILLGSDRWSDLTDEDRGPDRPRVGWIGSGDAPADAGLDFSLAEIEDRPDAPPPPSAGVEDVAHILFTSGSTGEPKGVMISHASVLQFVGWANRHFGAAEDDRNSGHSPLFFDLSTYDIYGSFAAGAELHLVPPEISILPAKVAQFIRERRLTQWFSVPSLLNYMAKFDAIRPGDFPELRRVIWCGEVFPTPALIHWMERLPHVSFTNLYGPTEATIASSHFSVPTRPASDRDEVPIGEACGGEELLVLDEGRRPVAPGAVGDLHISGVGLSPGYWRDRDKTKGAFSDYRDEAGTRRVYRTGDLARQGPDGLFYFLGRADTQIKSRGYRIELGEIEAALHSLGELRESAVVAVPTDRFEGSAIGCAFVAREGHEVAPAALRRALGELLPGYMLPSLWQPYDALPKTANGKLDRRAIREALAARGDHGRGHPA